MQANNTTPTRREPSDFARFSGDKQVGAQPDHKVLPARLKVLLRLLVLCALTASIGCGRDAAPGPAPSPEAANSQDSLQTSLPGLSELPAAVQRVSAGIGPGFMDLAPTETLARANATVSSDETLTLQPDPDSLSFALYGVYGFDGDARPTSVRVGLGDATAGSTIYLAYSDFLNGRWLTAGPCVISGPDSSTDIMLLYDAAHTDADSFTTAPGPGAQDGRFYFALLAQPQEANDIQVISLQLGTYGGVFGPRPGAEVRSAGFAPSLVRWSPSPDYDRPDFAGYMIERAPYWFGEFVPVSTEPFSGEFFIDEASTAPCRYRVYCLDSAGNRSDFFAPVSSGMASMDDPELVPRLELPRGPLYGAQSVRLDLSGSYTMNGDPIDEYIIYVEDSSMEFAGPDPVMNVVLQPGCYRIRARFRTAVSQSPTITRRLVVYPRWQAEPNLVAYTTDLVSRLDELAGGRLPSDDQVYFVGYDFTIRALVAYRRDASGDFAFFDSAPAYESVEEISDPVSNDEFMAFRVLSGSHRSNILLLSEEGLRLVTDLSIFPEDTLPVLNSLGQICVLWEEQTDVAEWTFTLSNLTEPGPSVPLFTNSLDVNGIETCYNPALERIDLLFRDAAGVHFVAFDSLDGTILAGPVLLSAADWDGADMEFDPLTGRSIVAAYIAARYELIEWEDDGSSTSVKIHDSEINLEPVDLMVNQAGERYCFFASGAGQARLFYSEPGSSNWVISNTMEYSADSGHEVAIVEPQSGFGATMADQTAEGSTYFCRAAEGDVELLFNSVKGSMGQGAELQLALSPGEVHALWLNQAGHWVAHSRSIDDGEHWTIPALVQNVPSDQAAALSASYNVTSDGLPRTAFISLYDGVAFTLRHWNGVNWVTDRSILGEDSSHPILSRGNTDGRIDWLTNSHATNQVALTHGDEIVGWVTDVYPQVDTQNVVTGAINSNSGGYGNHSYLSVKLEIGSSTGLKAEDFAVHAERFLIPVPLHFAAAYEALSNYANRGQVVSTVHYARGLGYQRANAVWLVSDTNLQPVRYEELAYESYGASDNRLEQLDGFSGEGDVVDYRRSSSAALAWGRTAVGIVASLDGQERLMEWSNFGDWETLELPESLGRIAFPQLQVLEDGSWLLVYLDVVSNEIRCLRTTVP